MNNEQLKLILNLINVVSQRGAIRADEMTAVGQIHDMIVRQMQENETKVQEKADD